jgi:hypothetical protein
MAARALAALGSVFRTVAVGKANSAAAQATSVAKKTAAMNVS